MRMPTRKLLDRAFSAIGIFAVLLMAGMLLVVLGPILQRGFGAYCFRATVEHRRFLLEQKSRGSVSDVTSELAAVTTARQPVYTWLQAFEHELAAMPASRRRELKPEFQAVRTAVFELIGPDPAAEPPVLMRMRYGQTRWDRAQIKLVKVLNRETWDYSAGLGRRVLVPRDPLFADTALAPLFPYVRDHLREMLRPRLSFYGGFLYDTSHDAHFFGGIGPETLGTLYLALGAMLLALPLGVVAAIYFQEYAREGPVLEFLRSCVSTLAGVPSIVFGLFGLAFFINTLGVSHGKSVLAGVLTLALLVLPTIIRASEEALRAVPRAYKEAALALGAGKWRMILTVVLPAALPGILTGVVISMGRAAGETAPIIFTAAVSVGRALRPLECLSQPTPALPWNIYNLSTEHEAVDEIRHVQYGMVATLVLIVLLLNLTAVALRGRITRRLKG